VRQAHGGLPQLRPPPPSEVTTEPIRWVYYPWRRTVVSVLGPRAFRLVRLDRNRNRITAAELDRLGRLRVGVVGRSVGYANAYTLAAQGLCGELRLADFDGLELSNLNRVPTTVFELGVHRQWSAPGGSPNSTSRSWCRLIQRLTSRQNRKARPAHDDVDLRELSPAFAGGVRDLQYNFRKLANTGAGESQVLVFRFSRAPRPSVASRRRGLHRVSSPLG
jgi:hypothetical protein